MELYNSRWLLRQRKGNKLNFPNITSESRIKQCYLSIWLCPKIDKLRSQVLGSFEITKTNEVNLHGFCTDSFLKLFKIKNTLEEEKRWFQGAP